MTSPGYLDVRIGGAQSGLVSIESFTYAPVDGKRVPVVLTAGRMPASPAEIALAPTTARSLHAGVGSAIRLTGGAAARTLTVSGIAFVPTGPHNSYDQGAWLTPGGYDRLFAGAHYAFKFHAAVLSLRPGANAAAVASRLDAAVAAATHTQGVDFHAPDGRCRCGARRRVGAAAGARRVPRDPRGRERSGTRSSSRCAAAGTSSRCCAPSG